mgnify:CR=1 FL=1
MLTSKVARRYAQGLLDFAKESNQTQTIYTEMKDIIKVLSESKDLVRFLETPFIDYKKKLSVVQEIFKGFSPVSQNFVKLVISRGRESHLEEIAQEYINKINAENNVQKVTLTTAAQLSSLSVDHILKSTTLVQGTQYELELIIKPEILGGYILRVGDQQIDASVKSKLNQIKKNFQLN